MDIGANYDFQELVDYPGPTGYDMINARDFPFRSNAPIQLSS